MTEQQFGWNYFENEVVIRDKQDKKRMIVIVFSNFMCIPYNKKSFDELVGWLNEQQDTIDKLEEENEQLRQMIKENVFQRYREGSLADLEFKAIAYDDIIKIKVSDESEPKVIVYCNYGKRENIMSFCQMFIPFGIAYEIKEVINDE